MAWPGDVGNRLDFRQNLGDYDRPRAVVAAWENMQLSVVAPWQGEP